MILENNKKVFLKGIIDRIDQKNGLTRIIDYKTGQITSSQLVINNMSTVCKDPNRSKAMQLMCYAWMYSKKNNIKSLVSRDNFIKKAKKRSY